MKVFISWSLPRSKAVATALYGWVKDVLQNAKPWMSDLDIEAGARWSEVIATGLKEAEFGIVCVTPENVSRPWLLYEAGALAKAIETPVVPLLFGFPSLSLGDSPLSQLQGKRTEVEEEMRGLVKTLNKHLGAGGLDSERLERAFDLHWPALQKELAKIAEPESRPHTPDVHETINEVLGIVRSIGADVDALRKERRAKGALATMAEVATRAKQQRASELNDEIGALRDELAASVREQPESTSNFANRLLLLLTELAPPKNPRRYTWGDERNDE